MVPNDTILEASAGDGPALVRLCSTAPEGAVIELPPGRYEVALFLDRSITLRATAGASDTVLVGTGNAPVVEIEAERATIALEGLTLREGQAVSGGGISVAGHIDLHIDHCVIVNNCSDGAGGGLSADWGRLTIRDTRFGANEAHSGGGAAFTDAANATLERCRFDGNRATIGAAVVAQGGAEVTLSACNFEGNVAPPRQLEPWGGDILFTSGTERRVPTVRLVGCDLQPATARTIFSRADAPGRVIIT